MKHRGLNPDLDSTVRIDHEPPSFSSQLLSIRLSVHYWAGTAALSAFLSARLLSIVHPFSPCPTGIWADKEDTGNDSRLWLHSEANVSTLCWMGNTVRGPHLTAHLWSPTRAEALVVLEFFSQSGLALSIWLLSLWGQHWRSVVVLLSSAENCALDVHLSAVG